MHLFQMVVSALVLMVSASSFAGSLNCTGDGVSYSMIQSDGGAAIVPTVQLVVNGDILVNLGMNKPGVDEAAFILDGKSRLLTKPLKHGDFVTTYFAQNARIIKVGDSQSPESELFKGQVVCRQQVYVGVPRP